MNTEPFLGGVALVLVGVVSALVEQIIYQTVSISVPAGPGTPAIEMLATFPELSVIAGVAVILISTLG